MKTNIRAGAISAMFLLLLAVAGVRAAEVPRTIAFQGVLKDAASKPITTPTSVTFTLYDAETAGTAVWAETKDITPGSGGLFSTSLGSATPLTTVAFDKAYWVGVKTGSDAEMTPRLSLQSVPYALVIPGITTNINGVSSISMDSNDFRKTIGTSSVSPVHFLDITSRGAPGTWCGGVNLNVSYDGGTPFNGLSVQASNDGTASVTLMANSYEGISFQKGDYPNQGSLIYSSDGSGYNFQIGNRRVSDRYYRPILTLWDSGQVDVNGSVGINGNASCNTLTLTSSARYKTNVRPISSALDTISRLQGVSYDWDAAHGGKPDIGFVAEDVAKVVPELVTMESDGVNAKGMDYSHLTALTVEAIKEQQTQIASLKAENADLKARLARVERLLTPKTTTRPGK